MQEVCVAIFRFRCVVGIDVWWFIVINVDRPQFYF